MFSHKPQIGKQYLISVSLIVVTSILCFLSTDLIGYRVVALILLLAVSILAMLFDIFPVLFTAGLSALIWNFFFIPPILTLQVRTPEDALMFLMYFVVALINAVLTFQIREFARKARDKEEKDKALKLYDTMLNSLSHELRTPIATIIGSVDTLKDQNSNLTPENRATLFDEIEKAGLRLNQQVENLLNMSRLDAGMLKPKLDWTDVNELLFSVLKQNQEDSELRRIEFNPDERLPLFKTDGGLLSQLVHNIFHNAIQYTPEGTKIRLEAYQAGECLILRISDDGPGIPESELDRVFEKFYRVHNSKTGGTGLGLSIVKGLTEAMGGEVFLENLPNRGAQFTLKIPAETTTINPNDLE